MTINTIESGVDRRGRPVVTHEADIGGVALFGIAAGAQHDTDTQRVTVEELAHTTPDTGKMAELRAREAALLAQLGESADPNH